MCHHKAIIHGYGLCTFTPNTHQTIISYQVNETNLVY